MMQKRYMSIWFSHLLTDWICLKRPQLKDKPVIFSIKLGNKIVVSAASRQAEELGINVGMPLADARAILPELEVLDDKLGRTARLLKALGTWCIRYSPIVGIDLPDGLMLEITGCTHLWGGEKSYLKEVVNRLRGAGYQVRAAISDTVATSWAVARFGKVSPIIAPGKHIDALLPLPSPALRLSELNLQKLSKLGLYRIGSFINMPASVLRRRFGEEIIERIRKAIGDMPDPITPIILPDPFSERLPSMEPINTRLGIEIAVEKLMNILCKRLQSEGKGLRQATLSCYRVDGKIIRVQIGTNQPSSNATHLLKLFGLKIGDIAPKMGIELFILDAQKVEDTQARQEAFWLQADNGGNREIAELIDRICGKVGENTIHRYLPQQHYWPERAIMAVTSLTLKPEIPWRSDKPRPVQLLGKPEEIEVTAPIPDYPPMVFRYRDKIHQVKKADGPERIEREWWLDAGEHRDYYSVEDELGKRYWLFRSGHYAGDKPSKWYLHGFFA